MKKNVFLCLILSVVLAFTTACDRRELIYDYRPYCDVTVEVDWSQFGETPTGMTVLFYPEDGSKAVTQTTHSVHSTKVSLREGRYNLVVFNQSPGEFGTIGFRGLDSYATAEVFAQEPGSSKGWYSKAEGEVVAVEPEYLGVATYEGFEVTEDMIDTQNRNRVASRSTITLTPKNVVADGIIIVHIKGIHNLLSARGSISGMAAGFHIGKFSNSEDEVTHLLESWKILPDETDYTRGVIQTAFSTFGMPGMKLSRAAAGTRATIGETIQSTFKNAILELFLLLVDNQTVVRERFQVKDHIEIVEGTNNIVLTLEIVGVLTLPDVKPEGATEGGGFDVTVDNWGEKEEIVVPL